MDWPYWVAGSLLLFVFLAAFYFNSLVRLRNRVREAFSGVDVQLKRRHDLVPNLVQVVAGYAKHEKGTLEEIARLRSEALAAGSLPEKERSEGSLRQSLDRLFVFVENYPQLKADKHFLSLQSDLVEIEDHLQYARRYYNGAVRDLRNRQEQFPSNFFAQIFGFAPADFFQLESGEEKQAAKVAFGNPS